MKKSTFNALLSKTINNMAFEELEKIKLSHSKVENMNHKMLRMRKYFMPSENNATKEEMQTIFKLRCRVTELKTNLKACLTVSKQKLQSWINFRLLRSRQSGSQSLSVEAIAIRKKRPQSMRNQYMM